MRLWRVAPLDAAAAPTEPGGALWFPRALQGDGRHDAPERYGCLYVAEDAASAVAELLAPFRGTGDLTASMLTRAGQPLALAALDLEDQRRLLDLDDPAVLVDDGLRPSEVATRRRSRTQAMAADLHERHPEVAGLRWWSTLESAWANVTLFDRAAPALTLDGLEPLASDHPAVVEAAEALGLA